jgi:hypothetical protein
LCCTAAGAHPLGRSRCGLRHSALERHAPQRSPKTYVAPLDAARRAARCCAPLERPWFSLGCTFGGIGAHLQRVGTFEGHRFGSGMPPPAPLVPMCVTTHGRTVCFDAYYEARQCFLYWIAHTHASYPRELAHISLTALARSAQCTGFYAWILDALSRARALTISRACSTVAGAHAHLGPAHVSYTQNLKSVAYLFSPRQHARCIARTRPHTLVCFGPVTTEVENRLSTP